MSAAQALHDLMRRERDGLERLRAVLGDEHVALTTRDTAQLEKLTAAKQALLEELEQLGRTRQGVLAQAGVTLDRSGFETLLSRFSGSEGRELTEAWQAIQEVLRACQEQNRINGLVLDASHRATQQALGILLGQSNDANTYDAQGAIRGTRTSRGFVKA